MSVRFGLIGYGLWGRHHARAIAQAPGAQLAAIACRSADTAKAARHDWPDALVTTDYRAVLSEIVRGHLGQSPDQVFPGFTAGAPLGILRTA